MARIKITDEQKIATLKEKLVKAKTLKDRYTKEVNGIQSQIDILKAKAKLSVIEQISNPEKLQSLLDLGIISQAQYDVLIPTSVTTDIEKHTNE